MGWLNDLSNEVFLLLIQYHVLTFTDLVHSTEARNKLGISCVVFTIMTLFCNLILNGYMGGRAAKLLCKRNYNRYWVTRQLRKKQ